MVRARRREFIEEKPQACSVVTLITRREPLHLALEVSSVLSGAGLCTGNSLAVVLRFRTACMFDMSRWLLLGAPQGYH